EWRDVPLSGQFAVDQVRQGGCRKANAGALAPRRRTGRSAAARPSEGMPEGDAVGPRITQLRAVVARALARRSGLQELEVLLVERVAHPEVAAPAGVRTESDARVGQR